MRGIYLCFFSVRVVIVWVCLPRQIHTRKGQWMRKTINNGNDIIYYLRYFFCVKTSIILLIMYQISVCFWHIRNEYFVHVSYTSRFISHNALGRESADSAELASFCGLASIADPFDCTANRELVCYHSNMRCALVPRILNKIEWHPACMLSLAHMTVRYLLHVYSKLNCN